ncbi:hypothetical protein BG55_17670 [Erwinia mallotivora]|uniref:Uncharacterized protein n=1 Tax=Erwinia mallotivora TaxID=69222 RepID=A0A014PU35_9GAMM|nr:hypothetical protein BG55_17670 [Erwinia mallotivora]
MVVDEVAFKIVDHLHGFSEGCLVPTAAHQNTLGAKHFRHLGQYGGAAVGDHLVGKASQQRIGGDPGQAVGTPTLQAKLQFAQPARPALVMAHHFVQTFQLRHPFLNLIITLLQGDKTDAIGIVVPQRGAKNIYLVVLTAKSNHQHRAGIWVVNHILQHGAGINVILPQLRAAKRVGKEVNAINIGGILTLFQKAAEDLFRDAVHAADGRQEPQLITDAHIPVATTVNLYLTVSRLRG